MLKIGQSAARALLKNLANGSTTDSIPKSYDMEEMRINIY
jgi:hypothetical protein